MTIIAYRDGVMAADSQVLDGDIRMGKVTKVARSTNGWLVGAAGLSSHCQKFITLYRHWDLGVPFPLDPGDVPLFERVEGKEFVGVAVAPGAYRHMFAYDESLHPEMVTGNFFAVGSGAPVALGAMEMGATAEQAVAAAIKYDIGCGGEITVLSCR